MLCVVRDQRTEGSPKAPSHRPKFTELFVGREIPKAAPTRALTDIQRIIISYTAGQLSRHVFRGFRR